MTQTHGGDRFDLAVVGAGILGLATALAAARRGLRVVVIDRDAQANGASVRNFGFVTVAGQERGVMWARARRARDIWCEVAAAAGITILHRGVWVSARRAESVGVLEAFMGTEMAEGCRLLTATEARSRCPALPMPRLMAILESSLELRVESRTAIPRLAAWLEEAHGVSFRRETMVLGIEAPLLRTSRGPLHAQRIAVCAGDDFTGLYPARFASHRLTRCKLQMLRLASPGFRLPAALMSDLGIGRYSGYAALPAAGRLAARLATEEADALRHGVHLIVVQSADGSLVVGDSHHYATTPDPYAHEEIDQLILAEYRAALGLEPPATVERWVGTYASASDRSVLIDAPEPAVRLATVTCGSGASTGFAIGEELVADLFGASVAP